MEKSKTLQAVCGGVLLLGAVSAPAIAGLEGTWIDMDPSRDGVQSVSWPQPSQLNIYIPEGLTGAARAAFEEGVRAWTSQMNQITVQFHSGEPPAGATNVVDVNITEPASPLPAPNLRNYRSTGGPDAVVPAGQDHASNVHRGQIDIPMEILLTLAPPVNQQWLTDMMRNVGTHEFGHVLGMDHCTTSGDDRENAMDDDFGPVFRTEDGALIGATPWITPTTADLDLLRQHYTTPTPGAAALLGLAGVVASRRRR